MPINIDGKDYVMGDGNKMKLFPISKLSQALTDAGYPRDCQVLRKWEKWGMIPPTIFRTGVKKRKRLYTKEQIDIIVAVAKFCDIKQGKSLDKFTELVWLNLQRYFNTIRDMEEDE